MSDSPVDSAAKGIFVRSGLIVATLVVVFDQITKWAVLERFSEGPLAIEVLPFFNLVLAWNRGISFGMFGASPDWAAWVLVALALGISGFLLRWMASAENRFTAMGLALIIGGAVGNVIDRVRFGAVVDFLDVHVMGYHWPAFNVADAGITVGAAALILESLFNGHKTP